MIIHVVFLYCSLHADLDNTHIWSQYSTIMNYVQSCEMNHCMHFHQEINKSHYDYVQNKGTLWYYLHDNAS